MKKFTVITLLCCLVGLAQCVVSRQYSKVATDITNANGEALTGSLACAECHSSYYESFSHTAHFHSSMPANALSIKANITDQVVNYYYNYSLKVAVEKTDSGFYQAAYRSGELERRHRIDLVIGSGRKGQTYLYWKDDSLYQLPLTYFSLLDQWVNSPGFPQDEAVFTRPIFTYCLDCHSTNFKEKQSPAIGEASNIFIREQVLLGIGCERCHGAGARHVEYHRSFPKDRIGKYIVNTSGLSRQLRLDACAACHSGMREPLKPAFSYRPGEPLEHYSLPIAGEDEELDVHGNQYGLLLKSKCFTRTNTLDCSSCHDPHRKERNLTQLSTKCMNCHQPESSRFCKLHPTKGNIIMKNCIDCHMPEQPSKAIELLTEGRKTVPDIIRTHWIKIYPGETEKVLKVLKTNSRK